MSGQIEVYGTFYSCQDIKELIRDIERGKEQKKVIEKTRDAYRNKALELQCMFHELTADEDFTDCISEDGCHCEPLKTGYCSEVVEEVDSCLGQE